MNRRQVLTGAFVAYNVVLIIFCVALIYVANYVDIGIYERNRGILAASLSIIGLLINIFSAIFYRRKTLMVFACIVNAIAAMVAVYYLWFIFKGRDIIEDSAMSLIFISVPLFYFTLLRTAKGDKYRYVVLAPVAVLLAISVLVFFRCIHELFYWPIFLIFIGPLAISGAIFVWVITASKK